MYAAVHAHPDGDATVARQALTASEYGYDGIVVRNHGDAQADYDPVAIAETYGVDVVPGVEVRAEQPSRASGFVGNYREDRPIVAVHGGAAAINRFAVDQAAVDVLAHPLAGDADVDDVLVRTAADNGVRLEVSLRPILRATGGTRVRAVDALQRLWQLVEAYDAPYVVSGDPRSHLALRAPRELSAVGAQLGIDGDDVRAGLVEWGNLADRNRARLADDYVGQGVRREEPGEE